MVGRHHVVKSGTFVLYIRQSAMKSSGKYGDLEAGAVGRSERSNPIFSSFHCRTRNTTRSIVNLCCVVYPLADSARQT